MEEDILQEISNDRFEDVYAFLQKEAPERPFLLNCLKSFERGDPTKETDLKVFCPNGEINSGVIIAHITYFNKCDYNFVKMHCSADKVSLLQMALMKTKKINWDDVMFEGLHFKLWPTLELVIQNRNMTVVDKDQYVGMLLPLETYGLFQQEVTVPEEFIVRKLTSGDTTLIDKTWSYHGPTTYDYIRHSIVLYGGLGLVCKQSGQLVSWAVGVHNTIGMLHTLRDYRKRGCATVVIKALARELILNKVQPVCLIKHDNAPSLKLLKKLGFVDAGLFYCLNRIRDVRV